MTAAEVPAHRRIRRRALWMSLGLVGLVFASGGGIFLQAWIRAGRVLDEERTRVAERTDLLRAERVVLDNMFDPPEPGNAWESFRESLKALDAASSVNFDAFPSLAGDEVPKIDDTAIALALEQLRPGFDHLKSALRRREVESGRTYEDLGTPPDNYIAGSIRWARIIADSALHKHRLGDSHLALELIVSGFALGQVLDAKGLLVEDLVRNVGHGIHRYVLKRILGNHQASAADLRWLGDSLDRLDRAREGFIGFVRREDLLDRQLYLSMVREGRHPKAVNLPPGPWYRRLLPLRMQGAAWLGWQEGVRQGFEQVALLEPAAQPAAGQKVLENLGEDSMPVYYMVNSVARAWKNRLIDRQGMTLARLAVAIALFEAEKGTYPAGLDDLVPGFISRISPDPWNGKPFRYANRGDSAIVYSLGGDGDDDGGRSVPDDDDYEEDGDIVWTVQRRGAGGK